MKRFTLSALKWGIKCTIGLLIAIMIASILAFSIAAAPLLLLVYWLSVSTEIAGGIIECWIGKFKDRQILKAAQQTKGRK